MTGNTPEKEKIREGVGISQGALACWAFAFLAPCGYHGKDVEC